MIEWLLQDMISLRNSSRIKFAKSLSPIAPMLRFLGARQYYCHVLDVIWNQLSHWYVSYIQPRFQEIWIWEEDWAESFCCNSPLVASWLLVEPIFFHYYTNDYWKIVISGSKEYIDSVSTWKSLDSENVRHEILLFTFTLNWISLRLESIIMSVNKG